MHEAPGAPLRVAVISESERQRISLKQILERNGLQVVADHSLSECSPGHLDRALADVLLIDLDDSFERELNCLDVLIEQSSLPILFNDGDLTEMEVETQGSEWGRKLVTKLTALVKSSPAVAPRIADTAVAAVAPPAAGHEPVAVAAQAAPVDRPVAAVEPLADEPAPAAAPALRMLRGSGWSHAEPARRVWVLGASIGGPQAVRRFLAELPEYLPVAFVLAQHIGANFVSLLAEQLNRATKFDVMCAEENRVLQHRQVLVAPVEHRIEINSEGRVELHALTHKPTYSPSIDIAMRHVAERYGPDSGAIVFTGMGDDGARGCRAVKECGGTVWAQDAASCVISSMADHARRTGTVTFNGTPEELAAQLVKHLLV